MPNVFGTYATYDSPFLSDDVVGLAALVEPRNSTTWDLIPEMRPLTSTEMVWYDAAYYDLSGEVGAVGWTDGVTTAALPIDTALKDIVQIGDVLLVEAEQVVVSAINRGASTVDVFARGHGSTVGVAHVTTTPIFIVGNANVEGTVDQDGLLEENLKRVNYSQIVQEKVLVTKTGANQRYEDIQDKVDEERGRAMSRAVRKLNQSVLFGEAEIGSKTAPRSSGGIDYWLRTTTDAINDDYASVFTEDKFQATIQKVTDRGGVIDVVVMSSAQKAVFNDLNNGNVRTGLEEDRAGLKVDSYRAEGQGLIRLIADPRLSDDHKTMYLLNTSKLAKAWFVDDVLRFEDEPANSRTIDQTLQGQFSMMMKDITTDHARVFGL